MQLRILTEVIQGRSGRSDLVHGAQRDVEPQEGHQAHVQLPAQLGPLTTGVGVAVSKHVGVASRDVAIGGLDMGLDLARGHG